MTPKTPTGPRFTPRELPGARRGDVHLQPRSSGGPVAVPRRVRSCRRRRPRSPSGPGAGAIVEEVTPTSCRLILTALVVDRAGRDLRDVRVRPGVRRAAGTEGRRRPPGRPLPRGRLMMAEVIVADADAWRAWLGEHHQVVRRRLAGAREEERDHADEPHLRPGARGGAVPRLDRRSAPEPGRADLHPALHAAAVAQHVVAAERRTSSRGWRREGRMLAAGRAEVERAKADGRWDKAYGGSSALEVPADLAEALAAGAAGAGDVRHPHQREPVRGGSPGDQREASRRPGRSGSRSSSSNSLAARRSTRRSGRS